MNGDIQLLVDSLRRGQYEDPSEQISALSAALREHHADVPLLLSLLRAPQVPLRLAALDACRERTEAPVAAALAELAEAPEARVRLALARVLAGHDHDPALHALQSLLQDSEEVIRGEALKSTRGRPRFRAAQEGALAADPDWNVRLAAANALETQAAPEVAQAWLTALGRDEDADVRRRCAELVERRMQQSMSSVEPHLPTDIGQLGGLERRLKQLGPDRFPQLMAWITARTTVAVDPQALAKFGADLTAQVLSQALPRAFGTEDACGTLLKLLQREPWRSIALLGPAGSGKSALVHELTRLLARPEHGGWRVLRMSPSDFMAGTRYLGEWETKVTEFVEAIRKPRRVLVYVPNLADLSAAGTWSKSDSSVATALAPHLEEGSVVVLGESTPEEYARGLGRIPSLQRLFDKVLVTEASPEHTRAILGQVRDAEGSALADPVLDQLLEVSGQFLGHHSRPGNAVQLLRDVLQFEKESRQPAGFRQVLEALSKSTGIPVDLLDDAQPLDPAVLRAFFEGKIIGQPEAVEAVVDLITLIKAGVTDPNKPFGVFLFVGPTGVGKTELARALAEFIFGDAARLKRFDMSEFASPDGFTRLIGGPSENGLLTEAVRQHPFSVVLLDEIEKSHVNVFDLCLQIFDAGRLTDGRGRTADFRRTIVILTSNIGASAGSAPLGFGAGTAAAPGPGVDPDRTFRELARCFRPEFLNRLDRILHFRPLSLQVAEQIARREIDLVLQRSGIRRRHLTLDIDPAVVSLVVREGYSPHFGARPLKRTVERLLLLPVARAISNGSLRGRTLLRLTARDQRVEAVITGVPEPKPVPEGRPAGRPVSSLARRLQDLQAAHDAVATSVQSLAERKSELLLRTSAPGFFREPDREAVFDEIHKLDQFLGWHQGLGRSLQGLVDRLDRQPIRRADEASLAERLDQLEVELGQLRCVAGAREARDLGDVLVTLTLIERQGAPRDAVVKLAGMYRALAGRHRFSAEVLGEFYDATHDVVHLLVAGLGAYALFRHESGLHQLDHRFKERTPRAGREVLREDREVVRVEARPAPAAAPREFARELQTRITPLKPVRKRLLPKADLAVSLFHEPSLRSLEFWTAGPRDQAAARGQLLLQALVATPAAGPDADRVVRQYDVGLAPRVKDTRTGRVSTRIDRIFKGQLGPFLPADPR